MSTSEFQSIKKFRSGTRPALRGNVSIAEIFHENTKLGPITARAYGAWINHVLHSKVLRALMQQPYKTYSLAERVSLEEVVPAHETEQAIVARRSVRSYSGESIGLDVLSKLLFFSYGRTDKNGQFRAVASGGALYPLELYVVPRRVSGLEAGVYHYNVERHSLDVVGRGECFAALREHVWFEEIDVENAAAVLIVTAIFQRTTVKYQDRGYRMVLMEAGAVGQNIALVATSMGIGNCSLGGFHDDRLSKFLQIDGSDEAPLLPIVLGRNRHAK